LQVHDYNDLGMSSPVDVGSKQPIACYLILKIHNGQYIKVDDPPTGFRCDAPYYHYKG
jgi:hypothetical protein